MSLAAGPVPPFAPATSAARRRRAVFPLAAVAAAVLADVAFDPVSHHVPLCPFHAVTGMWCPFCGGLRSVYALAHLDVRAAASANLLVLLAIPVFLVRWWRGATGRPPLRLPVSTAVTTWSVTVLLVVFTVVRNLPMGHWLAP